MGLFDQILGAAAGGGGDLGNILNTVQQLSGGNSGVDPSAMQGIMSVVGGQVRSALQEKRATEGPEAVAQLVSQFAGGSPNPGAVASLFSPGMVQQVSQLASQRTGVDAGMIQGLLPSVIPMVLGLLNSGGNAPNAQAAGGNPMLNAFLDADGDGDVDISDMMKMASRYMG